MVILDKKWRKRYSATVPIIRYGNELMYVMGMRINIFVKVILFQASYGFILSRIVVMPAYNAEKTLEKTLADVPMDYASEFILVDDLSKDQTISVARQMKVKISKPFTIYKHDRNLGYGGNQKTCYCQCASEKIKIVALSPPCL